VNSGETFAQSDYIGDSQLELSQEIDKTVALAFRVNFFESARQELTSMVKFGNDGKQSNF
jgi:hypothetical protein